MKNVLFKNFFREIKSSLNRFLSIAIIVGLGCAFFAGIRATSPDMILTADSYFDEQNLMDIRILSTWGLEDKDIAALKATSGVMEVEPGYSADLYGQVAKNQYLIKTLSLPEKINKIQLEEGELPSNANECVIDSQLLSHKDFKLGSVITLSAGEEEISKYIHSSRFTIVGVVSSSYYLSSQRESTKIGNGSIDGFIMLPKNSFNMEVYTDAYLTVRDAASATAFTKDYEDIVKVTKKRVKNTMGNYSPSRYNNVKKQVESQLIQTNQVLSLAKEELEKGKTNLQKGQQELTDGKSKLEKAEAQLNGKRADANTSLATAKASLDKSQKELDVQKKSLEKEYAPFKKERAQLNKQAKELNAAYDNIYDAIDLEVEDRIGHIRRYMSPEDYSALEENTRQSLLYNMSEQIAALDKEKADLQDKKKDLSTREAPVKAEMKQLEEKETQLNASWDHYNLEKEKAEQGLSEGVTEIEQTKIDIASSEEKLKVAEEKIAKEAAKYLDAQEQLREKEREWTALKKPSFYVLDRTSLEGYNGYEQDADRIHAIGQVFPLLFFLVAALVCLTTMTRMVEFDRTQIGTLKALGYEKWQIAGKYIIYALSATLGGSLIGMILGQKILPGVITDAYSLMYRHLPETMTPLHSRYSISSLVLSVVTILAATIFASYKELLSSPSVLMRPAAPQRGKRVFLESLPFLWKRLNFTQKVTLRNLIRYKKRFFMTVFGIGGCMALLLVGFGLQDSVFSIVSSQYDDIFTYDASIMIDEQSSDVERKNIEKYIEKNPQIEDSMKSRMFSSDVSFKGLSKSAYIFATEDTENLNRFISLKNRTSGKAYTLGKNNVIITEKLASLLHVSEGDKITLEEEDKKIEVTVEYICQNHISHYVYMSSNLYELLFQNSFITNTALLNLKEDLNEQQASLFSKKFLENGGIESVTMTNTTREKAAEMTDGMDTIIYVLILSAGALAFIVLYNLNNINITERQRELATIKVLGFYDGEVAGYVYRENILLTILGSLFGVFLGIFLHGFVITTAELDIIMFGREINVTSFIYSFLLTFLFSFIVNLVLYYKLKDIDMIESLKSVE